MRGSRARAVGSAGAQTGFRCLPCDVLWRRVVRGTVPNAWLSDGGRMVSNAIKPANLPLAAGPAGEGVGVAWAADANRDLLRQTGWRTRHGNKRQTVHPESKSLWVLCANAYSPSARKHRCGSRQDWLGSHVSRAMSSSTCWTMSHLASTSSSTGVVRSALSRSSSARAPTKARRPVTYSSPHTIPPSDMAQVCGVCPQCVLIPTGVTATG